ncbi:MAG: sulfite exporter TauE/SafE family protein [Promethearchaeia archaeon]
MELNFTIILIVISLGILFGMLSTIAGIGGGVFYVSFMFLALLIPLNEAIDTSTFVILITSAAGFISYLKQGRTNLKLSLIFSSFSILGGLLCWLFLFYYPIDNESLKIIFAILLIITGLNMVYKAYKERKIDADNNNDIQNENYILKDHDYKKDLLKGAPFFVLAGFTAYLLGIGGGVINTPALNLIFGFPIHNATAISTSIIFFTAIVNTTIKIFTGSINYTIGLLLGTGSVLGAVLGAKISDKMPKIYLKGFVAILIVLLGINMLV